MSIKIQDLISKEQISKIDDIVKKYKTGVNELEISIFGDKDSSKLLTLEKFNNLHSILAKVSKSEPKSTNTLDIILNENIPDYDNIDVLETYRLSINGLDAINTYMQMLHKNKDHLVFSVLTSLYKDESFKNDNDITFIKKIKNIQDYVNLDDIYIKFKLDDEIKPTESEIKMITSTSNMKNNKYVVMYRYKERSSFIFEQKDNTYSIDLTTVKTSKHINKIERTNYTYSIEIECIKLNDKKTVVDQLLNLAQFIIKCVQGSDYIVSKSESKLVLDKYRTLMGVDENRANLYARQPISLEVQHLVDNLPNRYAVTDKADGDRCFLLIYERQCYLISTNLNVINTGLILKNNEFNDSILDGEFILIKEKNKYLYMAFDCIRIGKNSLREESKFTNRLRELDNIVYAINECEYKHINVIDSKTNTSVIDDVIEFSKKNVIKFYNDINKTLDGKGNKIIVRRKFFMDSLGIKDNEIFQYTYFLWTMYTASNELSCPYILDGMIFQPLEQKYVIELDKSKLPEYKWKPPQKNSIDLYIEFVRDRESNNNKIIKVYDNSYDNSLKNKPYNIANLYVGLNEKGIEKPVLFGTELNLSQAHIYLDENNIPRSADGKIINDKTVVEFYFDLEMDATNPNKWIPMKTRFDKTESIIKYGKKYGNAQRTAYAVWRSITNPILMVDFQTLGNDGLYNKKYNELKGKIDFNAIKMENKQNIYFQKKTDLVKDMSAFHNYIKSSLIYTYINHMYDGIQQTVLDIGCGRGGDIQKFYYCEVENYVGIDPDFEALNSSSDGAKTRYFNLKKTHDRFPPMWWVYANPGAMLTIEDQHKIIGRMTQDNEKLINRFFTDKTKYDRINCQFVIHYLLENETIWYNYLDNMNKYLREGGLFIATTFDGNLIRDKLKDTDRYIEYYNDNGTKKVLFEIVKKYDDNDKSKVGQAIDVHMAWLFDEGVYRTEYLVYPEYFESILKERCNMEIVETGLFKDFYDNNYHFLKVASQVEESKRSKFFKNAYRFYTDNDINTKCHGYSFLNRYYIFRKKETDLAKVKSEYYGPNRKRIK